MKVAILAPIATGLYSRIVAQRVLAEAGLELVGVVARTPWSAQRIRNEVKRDGPRLLRKVYKKLILGEREDPAPEDISLAKMAQALPLTHGDLAAFCQANNVPYRLVKDHNEPASVDLLSAGKPDVIAFCGGGLIRKPVLDVAPFGVLNCHMGPLPEYRGMDVVEYPLIEREPGTPPNVGLTLHRMDRGVDTGPILFVRSVDTRPGDTYATLRQRMLAMMADCMMDAVCGLRDGTLQFENQPSGIDRQYYVMHPRVYDLASRDLERWNQSRS